MKYTSNVNPRDLALWEKMIREAFCPVAQTFHLELQRLGDGFFEIVSEYFAVRIRVGFGPWTDVGRGPDILVTIVPSTKRLYDWENAPNEIGIGVIAAFYEKPYESVQVGTLGETAKREAALVGELCGDLLSGKSGDFERIKEFTSRKIQAGVDEVRKMRLPTRVQKRWDLPMRPSPLDKEEPGELGKSVACHRSATMRVSSVSGGRLRDNLRLKLGLVITVFVFLAALTVWLLL